VGKEKMIKSISQLSIEKAEKYRRYIHLLVEVGGSVKGNEIK
jgi:hypothetical protein